MQYYNSTFVDPLTFPMQMSWSGVSSPPGTRGMTEYEPPAGGTQWGVQGTAKIGAYFGIKIGAYFGIT